MTRVQNKVKRRGEKKANPIPPYQLWTARGQAAEEQRKAILLNMPPIQDPHFLNPLPQHPHIEEAAYRAHIDACCSSLFAKVHGFVFEPINFLTYDETENLLGSLRLSEPQPTHMIVGGIKTSMRVIFHLMLQEKDRYTQGENGELEYLGHVRLVYHNSLLLGGELSVLVATAIAALKVEVLLKVVKAFIFARLNFLGQPDDKRFIPNPVQIPEYHSLPGTSSIKEPDPEPARVEERVMKWETESTANSSVENMTRESTTKARPDDTESDTDESSVIIITDEGPSKKQSFSRLSMGQDSTSSQENNSQEEPQARQLAEEPVSKVMELGYASLTPLGTAVDKWIRILTARRCSIGSRQKNRSR